MDDHRAGGSRWGRARLARLLSVVALAALCWGPSREVQAQRADLSTADRLRMLYATQLTFTSAGDPIIRLGLLEGRRRIEFTPNEDFVVLPSGEGGPVIELPGGRRYTATIGDASPGTYKHWVIVARLPVDQRERADEIRRTWVGRGQVPKTFDVGGLFAVRGQVFDSRLILFAVGGTSDLKKARRIQRKLRARHGIEGGIHSQLVDHPSGRITLEGEGVRATIRHQDILKIAARPGRAERIRYRIPGVPKNYSEGTETRTYTGSLILAPDRGGELVLINSLGAERVLKGTVPAEIYSSAPEAALRAQAIAARNEIFSAIGVRNLADPYMLRADIYDQVYGGVGVEIAHLPGRRRYARAGDVLRRPDRRGVLLEQRRRVHRGQRERLGHGARPVPARAPRRADGRGPRSLPRRDLGGRAGAVLREGFEAYSKSAPVSSSKLFRWEPSRPGSPSAGSRRPATLSAAARGRDPEPRRLRPGHPPARQGHPGPSRRRARAQRAPALRGPALGAVRDVDRARPRRPDRPTAL